MPRGSVWVSTDYTRAAPGGTGRRKVRRQLARQLLAQPRRPAMAATSVVFLDAARAALVEELGGMNIFFVFDGSMTTPRWRHDPARITARLTAHPGKDKGIEVREDRYSIDQWRADAAAAASASFACGTAAVVTPIGTIEARMASSRSETAAPAPRPRN